MGTLIRKSGVPSWDAQYTTGNDTKDANGQEGRQQDRPFTSTALYLCAHELTKRCATPELNGVPSKRVLSLTGAATEGISTRGPPHHCANPTTKMQGATASPLRSEPPESVEKLYLLCMAGRRAHLQLHLPQPR